MYAAFFGLKENPFGVTPDPRFVFWSRMHQEALAHLQYGIEERKGFILLTGKVGTGKTLLCRCLLERLGEGMRTALILNPMVSPDQFLSRVLEDFGTEPDPGQSPLAQLNEFLLEEFAGGRNCVLVIDEAQLLPLAVLEQVRLISNLETGQSKLVQIVLVGQEELNGVLGLQAMRQLRERIAVHYHLSGLSAPETEAYIRHRLNAASAGPQEVLTRGAVRVIHRRTGGNPRRINILCDRALLAAYGRGRPLLDRSAALEASKEMGVQGWYGRPGGWFRSHGPLRLGWVFLAFAGLLTGFLAGRFWNWP